MFKQKFNLFANLYNMENITIEILEILPEDDLDKKILKH